MSEFAQYIVTLITSLTIVAMVVLFSRKLWISWYRGHSHLGQVAIQSIGAWMGIILIAGLSLYFLGKRVTPSLTYLCCFVGTLPILRLQFQFKFGSVNDWATQERLVFDERDYRIGQEALQNAYLAFWILLIAVGLILHFLWGTERVELPYWSVMLVLPVIAMAVSIVHATSILVLYRRENSETVEDYNEQS